MKTRFAILLLLLMGLSFGAMAYTGSELIRRCGPAVLFADSGQISDADAYPAMHCLGYVSGFMDSMVIGVGFAGAQQHICQPDRGIENGQATRIFVKYLRDNPHSLHENGRVLLYAALANAYPCK